MTYPLSTVLIITEGLTEKKYLSHLKRRDAGFVVHVVESPRKDALSIVNHCKKEVSNRGLSTKSGDRLFCVIDVDYNSEQKLMKAIETARKNKIEVILSNPCFEVFFLYHFMEKVPSFSTPDEAVELLKKYIPDYSKDKDHWHCLYDRQESALKRVSRELDDIELRLGAASGTNIGLLFVEVGCFDR